MDGGAFRTLFDAASAQPDKFCALRIDRHFISCTEKMPQTDSLSHLRILCQCVYSRNGVRFRQIRLHTDDYPLYYDWLYGVSLYGAVEEAEITKKQHKEVPLNPDIKKIGRAQSFFIKISKYLLTKPRFCIIVLSA